MKNTRLEQLADGVFSIVMTILVFEITISHDLGVITNQQLFSEISKLLPSFLSYILSFTLLFTYWRAHHFFISVYAKNIDSTLTNINALFFMLVSLVPFSASLLGLHSNNELAITIFGINIILIGLTLSWMRKYVLYSEHIKNPEISHREILGSTVRTIVPVIFSIIAIILSFWSTKFSLTLFTIAVIFNLLPQSTKLVERIFNYK